MTARALTWPMYCARAMAGSGAHAQALRGKRRSPQLAYFALGLCGEAREAHHALQQEHVTHARPEYIGKAREELGDVAWYFAGFVIEAGVRVQWPRARRSKVEPRLTWAGASGDDLVDAACVIAECVKKSMQGRDLHRAELTRAVSKMALALVALSEPYGGLRAVLEGNLVKTGTRYPGGFTVSSARALDGVADG